MLENKVTRKKPKSKKRVETRGGPSLSEIRATARRSGEAVRKALEAKVDGETVPLLSPEESFSMLGDIAAGIQRDRDLYERILVSQAKAAIDTTVKALVGEFAKATPQGDVIALRTIYGILHAALRQAINDISIAGV